MKTTVGCLIFIVMLAGTGLASESTRLTAQWTLGPCGDVTVEELEVAAEIAEARLSAWGVPAKVELSIPNILVKLPREAADADRETLERILTARGSFALHDVIEAPADGPPPPEGFEVPRWATAPSPRRPPVFVRTEPAFTALPAAAPTAQPPQAEWASVSIHIPLATEDRQRFADFTESRMGKLVGIMIDGSLWQTVTVVERMFRDLDLPVDTTLAEARVLAALVADRPLGVCLNVQSESRIDELLESPGPLALRNPVIDDSGLDLYNRFVAEFTSPQRKIPANALLRLRSAYFPDDEAVAEYLWQGPDRERARVALNCLNAAKKMEARYGHPIPAEVMAEGIESMRDRLLGIFKSAGRSILGVAPLSGAFEETQVPLVAAIALSQAALLDENQVDLLSPPLDSGEELIVRGIEGGRYDKQEVRVCWLTGLASPDSLVMMGPEVDMRLKVRYTTRDGNLLPEWFSFSTGVPGDTVRKTTIGSNDYRRVGEYWLTERLTMEEDETTVAFEMVDAEVDIDLSGVDWSDSLEVSRCDELEKLQEEDLRRRHEELMRTLRKGEERE